MKDIKMKDNLYNYVKNNYALFDNLCRRLQEDYNGINKFDQYEEDRLIIYNVLEIIDKGEL